MAAGSRDLHLLLGETVGGDDELPPAYDTIVKEPDASAASPSIANSSRRASLLEPVLPSPLTPSTSISAPSAGTGDDVVSAAAFATTDETEDLPPDYSSFDAHASTFTFGAPFIYSTASSIAARYHVSQRLTRSGKPYQLRIRRLLGTESRRLSAPSAPSPRRPRAGSADTLPPLPPSFYLPYDEETTMYIISDHSSLLSASPSSRLGLTSSAAVELAGCRAHTLRGIVRLERRGGGARAYSIRFWHRTRCARGDALRPENEERLRRRGYRADEEWDQRLLFTARERRRGAAAYEWREGEAGEVIARDEYGTLEILAKRRKKGPGEEALGGVGGRETAEGIEAGWRDLLVTCWTARAWSLREFVADGGRT